MRCRDGEAKWKLTDTSNERQQRFRKDMRDFVPWPRVRMMRCCC